MKYQSFFCIPDDLIGVILFSIGYNSMSVIFQFCLLNGILKPDTLNNGSKLGNEAGPSITKKEVPESSEKEQGPHHKKKKSVNKEQEE